MTDEQIIKALECCFLSECACSKCPYADAEICETDKMINVVIDLINRQKADIKELEAEIEQFKEVEIDQFKRIFGEFEKYILKEMENGTEKQTKKYQNNNPKIINHVMKSMLKW